MQMPPNLHNIVMNTTRNWFNRLD